MTIVYEIICDNCGGHAIDYVQKPKTEYEKITMSDYINKKNGPQYTHDMYIYTQHKVICTVCGNLKEYNI